jgi:uncharacterized protein YdhG (YjbR/CyaY superfamily)
MTPRRRPPAKKTAKPKTVSAYLAAVDRDKRAALEKLRRTIKATVPKAKECIAYGVPSFRLDEKYLVSYAAWANHCSFYPGSVVQQLGRELKGFEVTKGGVLFQPEKPLPATLVRKLVKLRLARLFLTPP